MLIPITNSIEKGSFLIELLELLVQCNHMQILFAMHLLSLLVMWLGCWVLGVAFAAVELPHLLQQVGLNLHQFDAVRSS
jgi:hypothetical protein